MDRMACLVHDLLYWSPERLKSEAQAVDCRADRAKRRCQPAGVADGDDRWCPDDGNHGARDATVGRVAALRASGPGDGDCHAGGDGKGDGWGVISWCLHVTLRG